jgi:hypothetical protein
MKNIFLLIIICSLCWYAGDCMAEGNGVQQYQSIKYFPVVKYDISDKGKTFTVSNTGTPIDGISVIVPPGAITKNCELILGYESGKFLSTIHGTPSGVVLNVETPGITRYEHPIEVVVPLTAMGKELVGVAGYGIDIEGHLEPLTTMSLEKKNNTATFITSTPLKMTWIYF